MENVKLQMYQLFIEVLLMLQNGDFANSFQEFYEFREQWRRSPMKKEILAEMLSRYPLLPKNLLVEVNQRVATTSNEFHIHKKAWALVCILGEKESFPEPDGFFRFKSNNLLPAQSGIILDIQPGVSHDFLNNKIPLTFLSVQSNWINDDDFFLVSDIERSIENNINL